jgi:hypothetical protein
MSYADNKIMREALRQPFPKEQIGKIPASQGRPPLDYVGHAAVTDRLNKSAPDWSYTVDQLFDHGNTAYVRGTMTIGGVSRMEYGDGKTPKEAISNFIRRGAMRFGVALDLWSKEELESSPAAPSRSESPAGSHAPAAAGDTPSEGVSEGYGEGSIGTPSVDASAPEAHVRAGEQDTSTGAEAIPPPVSVDSNPGAGGDSPRKTKEHLKPTEHDAVWADSPTLSKYEICTFPDCPEVRRKLVKV